jgi:hypothetical protein
MKVLGIGLLGIVLLIAITCFFRVPQALLTRIFPNDYVYRLSVSVRVDGHIVTGETIAACRGRRDGSPDWMHEMMGHSPWTYRSWAVALDVELPGKGFLQLPVRSWCGPTSFRPEPKWKTMLGIAPNEKRHPRDDQLSALTPMGDVALLFDDTVAPTSAIGIQTPEAAEKLGIKVSRVTISPATWDQLEEHLKRGPGSPWLAPMTEKCISAEPTPRGCLAGPIIGYYADRYPMRFGMMIKEFADWADSTNKTRVVAPIDLTFRRSRNLPYYQLKPDVSSGRWHLTDIANHDLQYIVIEKTSPFDRDAPVVCLSDAQCHQVDIGRQALVNWTTDEVLVIREYKQIEHKFFVLEK